MNQHPEAVPFTISDVKLSTQCCAPEPTLQIRDLSISYSKQTILSDVSLDIYRGCITALIGPSGCGKTSFLSSLNGLAKLNHNARITGNIIFDGEDLLHDSVDQLKLRRRVGMIFQRPNPFPLSIWRNLELPLKEHGLRDRHLRAHKIEQSLKDVGLWKEVKDRLNSSALALSGGQQQRLCIARALVLEPEILLMDEPCSALDPISSAIVEELIQGLRGRYTVVIVTHNLAQARRLANYAGFFWVTQKVGKLIEYDLCKNLFDSPRHQLTEAYISGLQG